MTKKYINNVLLTFSILGTLKNSTNVTRKKGNFKDKGNEKKNRLDFAFATPLIKIENLDLFKYFYFVAGEHG